MATLVTRTVLATVTDIAIALGTFAVVTALAAALGAANFGTALGVGQVAFVIAATLVICLRK